MAADTILEKLTVDLTSASGEIPVIQNSSRGDVISYRDWEGRNVAVGISDKNILVWQYENPFENQEPEDWFYGPETYLGNEAADLRFNMQGTEVIQIILTLYDPIIDRSYEFSKMVSFETGQDG